MLDESHRSKEVRDCVMRESEGRVDRERSYATGYCCIPTLQQFQTPTALLATTASLGPCTAAHSTSTRKASDSSLLRAAASDASALTASLQMTTAYTHSCSRTQST